ncbi:MAG TPA: hypothetical protein PK801_00865 [Aggregatilineales bacterium]|nr:hypothetical protein [Aggregatilineales bacterium]HQA66845.1 hypothetical protein [Aggregatilineales bacterium]
MESPRRNGSRRLLGFILIGLGVLFLLMQMSFLAMTRIPRYAATRVVRDVRVAVTATPVPVRPEVDRQMEYAAAEAERQMAYAEGEVERQMAYLEEELERQMAYAERQMEYAERQVERAMREVDREMAHAEIRMERAGLRRVLFAPPFGRLTMFGRMLSGAVTLTTFALLGLGAFLLVREFSRNRGGQPSTPPATGPEADRARE